MKARNTKTGEVVTHFCISKEFRTVSYVDSKGFLHTSSNRDEWEIIEETETDSEQGCLVLEPHRYPIGQKLKILIMEDEQ